MYSSKCLDMIRYQRRRSSFELKIETLRAIDIGEKIFTRIMFYTNQSTTGTSKTLRDLENAGLITKTLMKPKNRNSEKLFYLYDLTPKGKDVLSKIEDIKDLLDIKKIKHKQVFT